MTIDSLKDLQKLIALCRKTGVESIKVDNVEMHLGLPPKRLYKPQPEVLTDPLANASIPQPKIYNEVSEADRIEMPDELTDEQKMFYSARPEAFEGQQ